MNYNFILQTKKICPFYYGCPKSSNCLGNGKLDGICLLLEKEIFMEDAGLIDGDDDNFSEDYDNL